MDVFAANEQKLQIDEARLAALARHALTSEEADDDIEMSVLFVDSESIRRLNAKFLGADYATDVLAFPMMEDDEDWVMLGDVYVCPEVARDNAARLGHSLDRELEMLVVHGILHLLGYDHQNDDDMSRMDARTRHILGSFHFSRA
ncbi:MAG: rRNA maturation RNase YbeY [Actinomycetota bacterium]|nr:rRNA maturation RNase YbeY [Actinomycetota bacterium]